MVTFGRKVMAHVYDSKAVEVGEHITVVQPDMVGDAPCPPSHIGISCGDTESPTVMYFQTDTRAEVAGLHLMVIEAHINTDPGDPNFGQYYDTVEDVSYISVGVPELFLIKPKFKVEVDKWHHLLVSFDFSTPVDVKAVATQEGTSLELPEALRSATINSYCKIWLAFDDENKKGKDNIGINIPPDTPNGFTPDPTGWVPQDENGIIPQNAESAVFTYTPGPPDPFRTGGGDSTGEYHWEASPIPMNGGPMGFPASEEYVETVYHCEMAEFQFFGNIVLNTGSQQDRRLFVDKDGKPVPPKEAEKMLGKPHILLHRTSNWKKGKNTGSVGLEKDAQGNEEEKPDGQFQPKG